MFRCNILYLFTRRMPFVTGSIFVSVNQEVYVYTILFVYFASYF